MWHPAINDVHRGDPALCGIQCAGNLGNHAAGNGAIVNQLVNAPRCELGEQLPILVQYATDVGQHQQFFGLQHGGQLGRHHVGVDVVALVVDAKSDGADHRNEGVVLQRLHRARVDALNIPHLTHIVFLGRVLLVGQTQLARADHRAVTPCQSHRFAASCIDHPHNVLLHFTGEHPLHHFHGFGIGHPHALNELTLLAQAFEQGLDLRSATVHHHGIDAHQLQQHHVFGEVLLQCRVGHGVATVLDDHGLAMKLADVRQCLRQDLCLFARLNVGKFVGMGGQIGHGNFFRYQQCS